MIRASFLAEHRPKVEPPNHVGDRIGEAFLVVRYTELELLWITILFHGVAS